MTGFSLDSSLVVVLPCDIWKKKFNQWKCWNRKLKTDPDLSDLAHFATLLSFSKSQICFPGGIRGGNLMNYAPSRVSQCLSVLLIQHVRVSLVMVGWAIVSLLQPVALALCLRHRESRETIGGRGVVMCSPVIWVSVEQRLLTAAGPGGAEPRQRPGNRTCDRRADRWSHTCGAAQRTNHQHKHKYINTHTNRTQGHMTIQEHSPGGDEVDHTTNHVTAVELCEVSRGGLPLWCFFVCFVSVFIIIYY